MRGSLVLALAAGATLAVTIPADAAAQSRSIRETWEQVARRKEREAEREEAREREQERERAQTAEQREQERERAQATSQREREERLRERERERIRALEREREQIRERERALERERERVRERERELERAEARRREDDRRNRDWDYDDDDYRYNRSRNAPSFCRSGEGHPVHGREWCRERGYELGRSRGWERARWGNIVFRGSRGRTERLSRSRLESLLGSSTVYRFERHGRQYGSGPITGFWMPENGNVLQLSVGGVPIARLIDVNRDRHVDYVLLRR